MNVNELDYSLADAIVFHDELNPALWSGVKMRPEVRKQLLKIAKHFIDSMELSSIRVVDITVSGSNAAYTYTPHSDVDLHLIADIPQMQDDIYRAYFDLKKYEYGNKHNIKIRGVDVELYVQMVNEPEATSMGVYSVLNDEWLAIPKKVKANIDDATVKAKVDDLSRRAELALETNDEKAIALVKDHIYAMRRAGLEEGGEFSPENLAFKILRTNGVIDALREFGAKAVDQELSLEQQNAIDAQAIIAEWRGVTEDISAQELSKAEYFINQLWSKLQVNINLLPRGNMHHFLDRVNDKRNGKDITVDELVNLFVKEYKKYGLDIKKIDDTTEVVFKDLATEINVPVVIAPMGYNTRIKAKTIMRKKNFGTSNPVLAVEGLNEDTIMEVPMNPKALQKFADTEAETAGVLVGFEFELYYPGLRNEALGQPDWDQDESAGDFSDIVNFFNNPDSDDPCGDTAEDVMRYLAGTDLDDDGYVYNDETDDYEPRESTRLEQKLQQAQYVQKEYGFLRPFMDWNVDPHAIIYVLREMYRTGAFDSRNIEFESLPEEIQHAFNEVGYGWDDEGFVRVDEMEKVFAYSSRAERYEARRRSKNGDIKFTEFAYWIEENIITTATTARLVQQKND